MELSTNAAYTATTCGSTSFKDDAHIYDYVATADITTCGSTSVKEDDAHTYEYVATTDITTHQNKASVVTDDVPVSSNQAYGLVQHQ